MTYSAVIHPPGLDSFVIHGGSSGVIEAVHQTIVPPCFHKTDPPGVAVKLRVSVTARSWLLARPSLRMMATITGRIVNRRVSMYCATFLPIYFSRKKREFRAYERMRLVVRA